MIETIMVMIVLLLAAKRGKGRGKRMNKYIRGRVNENLSFGTLAGATLVSVIFDETVIERTRVSSVEATYAIENLTVGSGDGPIMVGLAHSDYTDAQIEEVIENAGSWNEGDLVQQKEVGRRLVRTIGIFSAGDGIGSVVSDVLNDGKPIKTKLNWILITGQSLRLWAYNLGNSSLATTVPVVHCEGHANLWPQ